MWQHADVVRSSVQAYRVHLRILVLKERPRGPCKNREKALKSLQWADHPVRACQPRGLSQQAPSYWIKLDTHQFHEFSVTV